MNYNTSDIVKFNTDILNISDLTKFDINISKNNSNTIIFNVDTLNNNKETRFDVI